MNTSRHAVRAKVTFTSHTGAKETFERDFQIARGEEDVRRFEKIITAKGFRNVEVIAYTNEDGETTWL